MSAHIQTGLIKSRASVDWFAGVDGRTFSDPEAQRIYDGERQRLAREEQLEQDRHEDAKHDVEMERYLEQFEEDD